MAIPDAAACGRCSVHAGEIVTDLRARIADALREHLIHYLSSPMIDFEGIADVLLSLPGIAVVELPEGHDVGPPDEPCLQFTNVVAWPGSGLLQDESTLWPHRKHNPTTARRHAASLLAAADAAEEKS